MIEIEETDDNTYDNEALYKVEHFVVHIKSKGGNLWATLDLSKKKEGVNLHIGTGSTCNVMS